MKYGCPTEQFLTELRNVPNQSKIQKFLIFEDLSHYIQNMGKHYLTNLCNLVLESRHIKLSLLNIIHNVPFTLNNDRINFDKILFQNATLLVLFCTVNNCHEVKRVVQKVLPDRFKDFVDMIYFSTKMCKLDEKDQFSPRPYIAINLDPSQNLSFDTISRCATDIFGRQITFRTG